MAAAAESASIELASIKIELASIKHDFPRWRPWLSDSGRWYATRIGDVTPPEEPSDWWAMTVFSTTADGLRAALRSQEEGVEMTRPITYSEAAGMAWQDALMRWQELAVRDSITTADQAESAVLAVAEHLELLALREVLARYFRHPAPVQRALAVGATWQQVADATGCAAGEALAAYLRWTDRRLQMVTTGRADSAAPQPGDVPSLRETP
jgi:hypothetical protein